jgi:predicted site-specific integrase-resolvase
MLCDANQSQHGATQATPAPGNTGTGIAAIYSRVSTTDQADKGYSLPTQVEACMTLVQREGYTVPPAYIFAEDYTGTSLNRPQLQQLRELVRGKGIHALVVYDPDRLARKLALQLLLDEECQEAGVRVHFMSKADESAEGKALFGMRVSSPSMNGPSCWSAPHADVSGGPKPGLFLGGSAL